MTIKITDLEMIKTESGLSGGFNVSVIDGVVKTDGMAYLSDVSVELQNELFQVVCKIEDELNGVKKEEKTGIVISTPNETTNISSEGITITNHITITGEPSKKDAEDFIKELNEKFKELGFMTNIR